jgi:ubiquinone/menaquinone biosynthesis C-methylase UbiE
MPYIMEAEIEASRLEEQAFQSNYSIVDELKGFEFRRDERIMDAGCGTGVLSRYLVEQLGVRQVDAIDSSDLRLKQAMKFLGPVSREAVQFYRKNLDRLDPKFFGRYDTVICRFVVEHSDHPDRIFTELRKTLKPGGRLIVIELDGVFINLHSENSKLNRYMNRLKKNLAFDLEIGRKVPCLMKRAGFSEITWDARLLACRGERLREEYENSVKRFSGINAFLLKLFKTQKRCDDFRHLYLDEMLKEENTLVFTKYICVGVNA